MQKNIWYNVEVPKTGEKKAVPMPVKVTDSQKRRLEEIAALEDRPLGYVARELMIRGLALYEKDGRLRDDSGEQTKPKKGILTTEIQLGRTGRKRKVS